MTDEQKEAQQKHIEMHLLDQQIKQVQKQLQLLEQQILELNATKDALDDFAAIKPGTEILVPISSGIFVKGQIKDNKELTVNVGANVAVNKSIPETKKLLEEQLEEIKKFQQELILNLQKLGLKAQEIEKELTQIS